jgi:hypothetical protein
VRVVVLVETIDRLMSVMDNNYIPVWLNRRFGRSTIVGRWSFWRQGESDRWHNRSPH